MARVVFDTDVLIDHLDGRRPITPAFQGSAYSAISRAELYSWKEADEAVIDRLLDQFEEISVDRAIAEEAGRIRRIQSIRLPDALIAATAIIAKRPLFSRNVRHFRKVRRLRLHDRTP
jgi:predicted nucleic acid-binding protein